MIDKLEQYQTLKSPVPAETWAWNMYGAGVENIGREGKPERALVPHPSDDQLLVRVDAVGMCFSDVKLIQQGSKHPKLYNRDLVNNPTRLGHEVTMTIVEIGKNLRGQYRPEQRLAMQPDIYQQGMNTAYGYSIPGGLIQFHLLGPEVLNGDDGAYVLPVEEGLGYAEAALTEPWACVGVPQHRRLSSKREGRMWIVGQSGDTTASQFSAGLDAPSTIVLTDVADDLKALIQEAAPQAEIIERNGLASGDYAALKDELTGGKGFDDIVMLDAHEADAVTEAAKLIARRGTFNHVGRTPIDGMPQIDVGRIHYDSTAYIGNPGPDIAASYGEARNRCELREGGVALFVGAGGPMGQMHVQRAVELPGGPAIIIATDLNTERLAALEQMFRPLAEARGKQLIIFNPEGSSDTLEALVRRETGGRGADDVVVCVPSGRLMADSAKLMASDGMLVLFAGVPNGTMAPLNMSDVYLHNAQFTGTSGSRITDQALVIQKTRAGELSPNRSVAAIGGIEAARDGVQAMMEGRYAGKVVIFPQLSGLPLTGVAELSKKYPEVAAKLAPGGVWTPEAEQALIDKFWQP